MGVSLKLPTSFQNIVDEAKRKLKDEGLPPEQNIEQGQMAFKPPISDNTTSATVYTPPPDFDLDTPPPPGSISPIPVEGQVPIQQPVTFQGFAYLPPQPKYTHEQQQMMQRYFFQKLPTPIIQTVAKTGVLLPKKTPEGFEQHWGIPTGVKEVGATAYPSYYRYAYESLMGVDVDYTGSKQKLTEELMKSRYWWEKYARFDDDKTFKDIKKEHPYVYLTRDVDTGVFSPTVSFIRYQQEQVAKIREITKDKGILGEIAYQQYVFGKAFGAVILKGVYDPYFWFADDKAEFLAAKEYGMQKKIWTGDVKGYLWEDVARSPGMMNIVYPMAAGAGIGKGLQLIGAAGKAATGTAIGRVLTGYSRVAPYGFIGVAGGTVGTDIGLTAGRQDTGDWVKDWTSPEVLSKVTSIGMQFASAYAGYRWSTRFKPTPGIGVDKYGNLVIRKHLTSVFGEPVLGYGKPVALGATVGDGIARIVSPGVGRGISRFLSSKSFLQKYPMQDFGSAIRGDMIGSYQPSGLAKYQAIRFGYTSPVGKPVVYGSQWGDKLFVETGLDWQPEIANKLIVKPSTDIIPSGLYDDFKIPDIISWQPSTGLTGHPSSIRSLDNLFKIYRDGKITTEEYQDLRSILKKEEDAISKYVHPLSKPFIDVKPSGYKVKPIKLSAEGGLLRSEWYDKTFVETGLDWQPKSSWGKLSTMVYPKPIPYRAYETYYRFMVYTKPVSTLFRIGTKPVFLKPSKQFTAKDVVPSDKSIMFDKGDISSVSDQGTISIQEAKVDVISETKTEQITSPLSKDIVVPQSLLKPVYSRVQMFKPKLEQRFQGLRSVYKTEQIQKQGYISLLQPLSIQMTKQAYVSAQALDFKKIYDMDQTQIIGTITDTVKDVAFDTVSEYEPIYKFGDVFEQPTPPETFITDISETFEPTPKKKLIKFPSLPDNQLKKKPITVSQGFNVYVKSRQYYKGKPKGIEKFRLLTKRIYNRDDAQSLLLSALDNSIAQTGYIKETDKPVQKMNIRLLNRGNEISYKFINRNGKAQELRDYAIDTSGEVNELDAFRWLQQQPRIVKTKKKTSAEKKTLDVSDGLFDFNMGFESMDKIVNRRFDIGF